MLPAAIEMMDNLAIQASEAAVHAGYPNCGALLLVELDGPLAEVECLTDRVDKICTQCGAWEVRVAQSEAERMVVWKGRKAAFAAMGRISPNYIVQDGVIPRTALPQVLAEIERMSAAEGCASPMFSMPATAIFIPLSFMIAASPVRKSGPLNCRLVFSGCASNMAGRSPGNMESAKRRR